MSWIAIVPFAVLALAFVLRIPVAYGMMGGGVVYLLIKGMSLTNVASQILGSLFNSYTVIAVPLFIFSAQIMNSSTVTDRVFGFANAIVGKRRGGLGHVNCLASLVFSGMTGSAVADASGLGMMEIEAMRREGYDDGFSCAITAASATMGPIFPPSIPIIMYSLLSGASVGALFLGGMVPAIMLCLALMVYVAIVAKKRNYPVSRPLARGEFWRTTLKSIPALLTPVILLGGIYTGICTPTEAGAVAAFYTIVIALFVYRTLNWSSMKTVLKETVKSTGSIGIMIGASACLSYCVTLEHIPDAVAAFVFSITTNRYLLLLIINVVFLILGMFIDTQTMLVVFIPIVIPVVKLLGIDLVHFGVMIVLNTMIGLSTPPFGMLLFVTHGVSGTPLKDIIREICPMILVMIAILLLITFIPPLVTFLPGVLSL